MNSPHTTGRATDKVLLRAGTDRRLAGAKDRGEVLEAVRRWCTDRIGTRGHALR